MSAWTGERGQDGQNITARAKQMAQGKVAGRTARIEEPEQDIWDRTAGRERYV